MFAQIEPSCCRSRVQSQTCAVFWSTPAFRQIGRRWPRLIIDALAVARAGYHAGISDGRSTSQTARASGKRQEQFGVCCSQLPALNRALNAGRRHGWRMPRGRTRPMRSLFRLHQTANGSHIIDTIEIVGSLRSAATFQTTGSTGSSETPACTAPSRA